MGSARRHRRGSSAPSVRMHVVSCFSPSFSSLMSWGFVPPLLLLLGRRRRESKGGGSGFKSTPPFAGSPICSDLELEMLFPNHFRSSLKWQIREKLSQT